MAGSKARSPPTNSSGAGVRPEFELLLALRRFAEAQRHFPAADRPREWALAASRLGRHGDAARVLSDAGHPALAAVELEMAGAHAAARLEWERAARDPRLGGQPYETALVRFSLGQALLRTNDRVAGARELKATQRLLEGLADEFETHGEAQRALDCYRLLLRIGRDMGSFENAAEGYLNSIRILVREDRKVFALQYYEDFLAFAVERKEWYAAATARAIEAAAYSLQAGFVFDRRYYLARAAELWQATAADNEANGGPTDLSENALHAAVDAAATLGDHALVSRLYRAPRGAAAVREEAGRATRGSPRAAARPDAAPSPPAPGFPPSLRSATAYQDVSRQDLVEWELDGDPTGVLARLVVDLSLADRKYARQALRAVLVANAPGFSVDDARAASELALALGRVQVYEVLRPLERLFDHGAPPVRAAVMTAVGRVYNRRSFNLGAPRARRSIAARGRRGPCARCASCGFTTASTRSRGSSGRRPTTGCATWRSRRSPTSARSRQVCSCSRSCASRGRGPLRAAAEARPRDVSGRRDAGPRAPGPGGRDGRAPGQPRAHPEGAHRARPLTRRHRDRDGIVTAMSRARDQCRGGASRASPTGVRTPWHWTCLEGRHATKR